MKIKAILFDLDGTLLPMDQDDFIKAYLGGLVGLLAPFGYKNVKFCIAHLFMTNTAGTKSCQTKC